MRTMTDNISTQYVIAAVMLLFAFLIGLVALLINRFLGPATRTPTAGSEKIEPNPSGSLGHRRLCQFVYSLNIEETEALP